MKKVIIMMICLVLLAPAAFSGDNSYPSDDPGSFEPREYDNAKVLRVKYTQGEAYVKRSYDDDGFEEAAINLPVFEKDTAGTTDGRLEIYMGRLNYIRLDNDTEVVFDKVPELRKTDLTLRILHGGIYLDIENLDYERDIEIQTADCGVFLLDKGVYRINVNEGGRTEVFVFDGVAEVAGDNFSRNVRENQKIVMFNGEVKERPYYFYSTDKDDFDLWNRERNNIVGYSRFGSSRYLDNGYEEYEYELSRQGNWKYHSTYNTYIWIPYSVGAEWRPYYNGRWVWNPYYGYVWMSFDSWGYFTHHYGRWHWDPIYHWHWIPSYRWSPAWVSWFWDDHYYGWCPLSWWNRPVIVINGHWWRDYHYRGGIPVHARSTTIIRKGELTASRINRVALSSKGISKISKNSIAFRGNSPNFRPVVSRVNVINARGKSVVYKQNGIVSTSKYKVIKDSAAITPTKGDKTDKTAVYKYSGKTGTKEKTSKYTKSPYSMDNTYTPKTYKSGSSSKTSGTQKIEKSYGDKTSSTSGSGYRPSSGSTSTPSKTSTIKRSSGKSSTKSSKGSSSSSSSKPKIKKKKDSAPSYSYKSSGDSLSGTYSSPGSSTKYSYKSSSDSYSSSQSSQRSYKSYKSKSYSSKSYGESNTDKSYRSSSSPAYESSYKSSYKRPAASTSGNSSYSSSASRSYRSSGDHSSSYKSYSAPSSSYRSPSTSRSYTSSSSGKSYSRPSSSYNTPRTYSRPSTSSHSSSSYKPSSSSSRSSSHSSSSHSRSSSSSHSSSSSSSFKKKN